MKPWPTTSCYGRDIGGLHTVEDGPFFQMPTRIVMMDANTPILTKARLMTPDDLTNMEPGEWVRHKRLGDGVIRKQFQAHGYRSVVVYFPKLGVRELLTEFAAQSTEKIDDPR